MTNHFESLRSNVKGLLDIQLGPCTCITGGNRIGKSSVLDTVRLAVTGKHPVGAHPSDLLELAPAGADQLYAELAGPSGRLAWRMDIHQGKARRSQGVMAEGFFSRFTAEQRASMLVLDHNSISDFGAERMRRAVMARFGDLDAVKEPAGLNEMQRTLWGQAVNANQKGDAAERLGAMQKWFKSAAKQKGDEAKRKEHTVQTLQQHTADVGGADVLSILQAKLRDAQAFEAAQASRLQRDKKRAELEDVNARIRALEDVDADSIRTELAELSQEIDEANSALTRGRALASLLERADRVCPCCGTEGVDLDLMRSALAEGVNRRQAQLAELSVRRASLTSRLPDAALTQARQERVHIQAELRRLEGDILEYSGPTVQELQRQVDLIRDAQANKQRLDLETEAMHQLLDEQATAKLLERQVTTMLSTYLQKVRVSAEAAVNRYMPAGFRTELRVTDTACEWRMVGQDQRAHKTGAYSGSEGGSLALARAQAWGEDAEFKLVLQDDTDLGVFDCSRLRSVFAKFKATVEEGLLDQVILVWNRPHEVPSDWTIVYLGE